MAEIKFSQLTTAAQLTNDDIFALAQMQGGSLSSVKTSMIAVANFLNTQVQYTTAYNTQAKTTAGAINELKQLISLIPQFAIEVVEELPTEDISDTTIYLVPAEDPEVGNYYEEYIHVNDSWELVGTTAVDLSTYYTKLEVDGLLATKASVAEVALKENKTDMPTDVRTIIKDCKTPKSATITNGIAQFECIEENLVKGLKVSMSPIQDLHGYDNPWVGGAGKNKFVPWNYTAGGLSWVNDNNKLTITVNSTNVNVMTKVFEKSLGEMEQEGIIVNGHTYTAKQNGENQGGLKLQLSNGVGGGISDLLNGYTFTYNSSTMSAYTFVIRKYGDVTVGDVITFYPQLEEGSTATDWTPYENICPISGRTESSVTRTGKNLFDKSSATQGKHINNDGTEVASTTDSHSDYIMIEQNKPYYFTNVVGTAGWYTTAVYDENKNFLEVKNISGQAIISGSLTFTRGKYIIVNFRTSELDNVQVEPGSTATAYEPYTAETKTHQYSDTIYGGVDDFVNGGLSVEFGFATFDGTENWVNVGGNYPQAFQLDTGITDALQMPLADQKDNICSLFPWITADSSNVGIRWQSSTPSSGRLFVYDSTHSSDLAGFKAMLANNNLQICYLRRTPTTISTSAEEITTVAGTNIISGTEPISECQYTELATVDDLRKIIGGQ